MDQETPNLTSNSYQLFPDQQSMYQPNESDTKRELENAFPLFALSSFFPDSDKAVMTQERDIDLVREIQLGNGNYYRENNKYQIVFEPKVAPAYDEELRNNQMGGF